MCIRLWAELKEYIALQIAAVADYEAVMFYAEKGWIGHSTLTAIANAIREKSGDTALLLPGAMAQAIRGMPVPDETVKQLL
jgi:hypothetical protein